MTDNKKDKQTKMTKTEIKNLAKNLLDEMESTGLVQDIHLDESTLNTLAIKIVSRMVKLKSMEDWFKHVSKSDVAWNVAYDDLELTEEEDAIGEAAKLMTLMNLFKEDEEYEKCAIIKDRMEEVNKILRKGNK
jgi:hypothetical protein